MSFHVINAKGLFSRAQWTDVLTEHAFSLIKERMRAEQDSPSADIAPTILLHVQKAIDLIDQLPIRTHSVWFCAHDQPNLTFNKNAPSYMSYGHGDVLCRCVVSLDNFTSSSGAPAENVPQDIAQWGLQQAQALCSLWESVETFVRAHKLDITLSGHTFRQAKTTIKRFQEEEYRFKVVNPALDLGEVDACVVYFGNAKKGGYLDGRGHSSPLAGARLFESATAALRTIQSRSLKNAVVVEVKAAITGISPTQKNTNVDLGPLQEALALVDKKRIQEALQAASIEELRARLQQLEPDAADVAQPAPPRRRSM